MTEATSSLTRALPVSAHAQLAPPAVLVFALFLPGSSY